MSKPITALGIRTASIETEHSIRQSVVFDLTAIGPNQAVVAAELRLSNPATVTVDIGDPSGEAHYGSSRPPHSPERAIQLNAAALNDLRQARGSFFWVDTTTRLFKRDPSSIASDSFCTLDLVVVASTRHRIRRSDPGHAAA